MWYEVRIKFHLIWIYGYPIVPAPFVKKTIFYLGTFVKTQLIIYVWVYFWFLYSVPLIYMSIFTTRSPYLVYCTFSTFTVLISDTVSSTTLFFFKSSMSFLGPLHFLLNLEAAYQFPQKRGLWSFDWDSTECIDQFGENWHLFFFLIIYLFIFGCVGSLFLCEGFSLVAASGGHSSSRCAGLSLSRPLLLRSTGSRRAGSAVVAHGPSCSAACGIFPDQGSNPCPLRRQADSQPLRHQGSPRTDILIMSSNPWTW